MPDRLGLVGAAGAAIVTAASLLSHNVFVFTTLGLAAIFSGSAFVLATVFAHFFTGPVGQWGPECIAPQTYAHR